jgi:hypothetical protein
MYQTLRGKVRTEENQAEPIESLDSRRTNKEFRLNANIGDFSMGDVILDLGSEVNVLPKNTWQCMGETTLGYSPIQLKLANQHRVLPIGRLKGVTVDLDRVRTKVDFEVI